MNILTNTTNEYKSNSLRKKPSFRRDGSYRIFHITKKQKEESDDDDDNNNNNNLHTKTQQIINKENELKPKYNKKSFKISNRNGLDRLKRKSTKNKRLLFLYKASCESTSNDIKTPPSSNQLINDLSQSIIYNDETTNQLLKTNKQSNEQNNIDESSESNILIDNIGETIDNNNATLNDLLARADKLETTVKKQDFIKIQPISRTNSLRKYKRFIITCSTVLITITILITLIIFIVIMTLRHKARMNSVSKT